MRAVLSALLLTATTAQAGVVGSPVDTRPAPRGWIFDCARADGPPARIEITRADGAARVALDGTYTGHISGDPEAAFHLAAFGPDGAVLASLSYDFPAARGILTRHKPDGTAQSWALTCRRRALAKET